METWANERRVAGEDAVLAGWWSRLMGQGSEGGGWGDVAQVVGRREALLLVPWPLGVGTLVWVNASTVRHVCLSELADFAGNDQAAALNVVARGRIVCSVSLEAVPPPALLHFLKHVETFLRAALLLQKEAVANAEKRRLAAGGHADKSAENLTLVAVEVPPSLRNKEVVRYLERSDVAAIFTKAKKRHELRRSWTSWQRALLKYLDATPPGGDGDTQSLRREGASGEGASGERASGGWPLAGQDDDPLVVVIGGSRRMFAVTRHRILWTRVLVPDGQGAAGGDEGSRLLRRTVVGGVEVTELHLRPVGFRGLRIRV
jgi:hypothetical protein